MEMNAGTKDARGRVLEEGDEIILNVRGPIYYRVMQIVPTLDPKLPPDLLTVHVAAMIPFYAKRGDINREFVRVRTAAEAGPLPITIIEARPAGDEQTRDGAVIIDQGGSER